MTTSVSHHPETHFRGRLRNTLTFFFIVLAVVPVALLTWFVIRESNSQAHDQAVRQLEAIADFRTNEIQDWLAAGQAVLNTALDDTLQYARMTTTVEARDRRLAPATQVDQYLSDFLETHPIFTELFLYTPTGEIRAATDAALIGQSVADAPFFAASLEEKLFHPIYYDESRGTVTLVASVGIENVAGEQIGVLAGRFDLEGLYEIVSSQVGLGQTGETYLISGTDSLLVSPSRFEGYPLAQPYHSQGIDRALKGEHGSDRYLDYRGFSVIGVYRWLPEIEAAFMAEINADEAFHAGRQLGNLSLMAAISLVGVALIVGMGVTLWITQPIRSLTNTATLIASGDYSQRAEISRQNEIGQLACAFNSMTDQLLQKIDELDRHVKELDKTNKALRVATARAKEAARIKGEFLSTMSHELRTPLNAIIGFSDMLLMGMSGPLNEAQTHKIQRLRENGKRLLDLVNDSLDLTRIESGRIELNPEPFSPAELVDRLAAQMVVLAEQNDLEFKTILDPQLPSTLIGDVKRIEQVLVNLLSNAFKFTETGTVTLEICVQPADKTWSLAVSDTGIGIPPHALDLIFEEFRQLDGSSKRVYKGTGLGLAITRQLTRIMEGKVSVESELEVGSTFTITLPMETPETIHDELIEHAGVS